MTKSETKNPKLLKAMKIIEDHCKKIGYGDYQILTGEEGQKYCEYSTGDIYFSFDGGCDYFYYGDTPAGYGAENLMKDLNKEFPNAWYEFGYHWNMSIYEVL